METPFLPQEVVVLQILARLPVMSLLRFRCVCKAWRHAIDDDAFFHRAHIRLQKYPSVIIALKMMKEGGVFVDEGGLPFVKDHEVITAGVYRWDHENLREGAMATTLVGAIYVHHSFPRRDYVLPDLAHCDGLLLLPADATALVLNLATHRAIELPSFPNVEDARPELPYSFRYRGHQTFGLGLDPRSNTYKVARFFYRSIDPTISLGMEVCTVGRDQPQYWRETAEPPPYPIRPARAATFFKGSLLWTIEESLLVDDDVPGFVRLRLDDESFSVIPLPPCCPRIHYATSSLAELRGELCLCVVLPAAAAGSRDGSVEMWVCSDDLDSEQPRWHRRHVLTGAPLRPHRLIAVFDEEIVFELESGYLSRFSRPRGVHKDYLRLDDMRYRHPNIGAPVGYTSQTLYGCDVVPCVQSLITL
ncbi:hypothetical protein QYE76_066315 [Lolium multiflorum]|uniref:F-box domain-containing protein n=1 Tax=Lolium multiflorum TaxID=4521 RepID=A0AAD8SCN4_LOLMU|nr:hypothetical protein QYE76_066315 [Lolium multiflorum]